jgi:translocation and assembly module TamB
MRLLDPVLGYPFAPEGIAHLDLDAAGQDGEFRTDGNVHVDGGSYIGTGVVATGLRLDAHVHADPARLLVSSIVIRLRQGGQMEGVVDLSPWLPPVPGEAVLQASAPRRARRPPPIATPLQSGPRRPTIPINGKVTAQFKDVTLDTILDMVSQPPFQRLGFRRAAERPRHRNLDQRRHAPSP